MNVILPSLHTALNDYEEANNTYASLHECILTF